MSRINIFVFQLLLVLLLSLRSSCSCRKGKNNLNALYTLNVNSLNCTKQSVIVSFLYKGSPAVKIEIALLDKYDNVIFKKDVTDVEPNITYSMELVSDDDNDVPTSAVLYDWWSELLVVCFVDFNICYNESTSSVSNILVNIEHTSIAQTTLTSSNPVSSMQNIVYISVPISAVLFFSLLFVYVKLYKNFIKKIKSHKSDQSDAEKQEKIKEDSILSKFDLNLSKKTQEIINKSKQTTKLFIIYMNDHKKHRDVVINFAKFLQADLGFEVFCELFESENISADPCHWMEKCLEKSDKVIVIWSPAAIQKWNKDLSSTNIKHDLFTPVLKQIRNALIRNQNIGKYYFAHFEYCSSESIPEVFAEPKVLHFKLMQEFDDLYFRLKGIEKYIPGGEIKEEKVMLSCYSDPSVNEYGLTLQESILSMTAFAKKNPRWYLPEYASSEDNSFQFGSTDCENNMQRNILNISPPPPLANYYRENIKERNDEDYDDHQNYNKTYSYHKVPIQSTAIKPTEVFVQFNVGRDEMPLTKPCLQIPTIKSTDQNCLISTKSLSVDDSGAVQTFSSKNTNKLASVVKSGNGSKLPRSDFFSCYVSNSPEKTKYLPSIYERNESDLKSKETTAQYENVMAVKDQMKDEDFQCDKNTLSHAESAQKNLLDESHTGYPKEKPVDQIGESKIQLASLETNTHPMASLMAINGITEVS